MTEQPTEPKGPTSSTNRKPTYMMVAMGVYASLTLAAETLPSELGRIICSILATGIGAGFGFTAIQALRRS